MVLLCGVMPSRPSCNHYAPRFMSRPAEALSSSGIRLKCLNTQKTVFCIIQCSVSNHSIWNSSSFIYCSVWIFGLHWFMQHAPDSLRKRFCHKTAAAGIQCVCVCGPLFPLQSWRSKSNPRYSVNLSRHTSSNAYFRFNKSNQRSDFLEEPVVCQPSALVGPSVLTDAAFCMPLALKRTGWEGSMSLVCLETTNEIKDRNR